MTKFLFTALTVLLLCCAKSSTAQELTVPSIPPPVSSVSTATVAAPPAPLDAAEAESSPETNFKKPQQETPEVSSVEAAQKLFGDHPSALVALALVLIGPLALWLLLRNPKGGKAAEPVAFYDASMQQTMVSNREPEKTASNSGFGLAGAALALAAGLLTAYLLSARLPPVKDILLKVLTANALAFATAGWFAGRAQFRLFAGSAAAAAGTMLLGAYTGANLGLLIGTLVATLLAGDLFITALTTGLCCTAGLSIGIDRFRLFAGKGWILALFTGKTTPPELEARQQTKPFRPVPKMDVERFTPPAAPPKPDQSRYAPHEPRENTPREKTAPPPQQELVMERFGADSRVLDEKPKTKEPIPEEPKTAKPAGIVIERFDAGFIKPEDLPKPAPKAPAKPDIISLAKVTVNNVKLDLPARKETPVPEKDEDIPPIKMRASSSVAGTPPLPPLPPRDMPVREDPAEEAAALAEQTFSETKPEPFSPKAAPKEERLNLPEEKPEETEAAPPGVASSPAAEPVPAEQPARPDGEGTARPGKTDTTDFTPVQEGAVPSTPAAAQEFAGHKARIAALAVSSDGKLLLSGGDDNTLRVWNTADGSRAHKMECGAFVTAAAWSPDGAAFAFATTAKLISLRQTGSWTEKFALAGHAQPARCAAFSPDGKLLASAGWDNTVKIWPLEGEEHSALKTIEHHSDWVSAALFSPDGKLLLSASYDCTAAFWNTDGWTLARQYDAHASIYAGAFSPDGKTAALACEDKTIRLLSTETGEVLDTLKGLPAAAVTLSFSPDGKWLACGCKNGNGALWGLGKKALAAVFSAGSGGAKACVFMPDSSAVCTGGDDGALRRFSLAGLLDVDTARSAPKPDTNKKAEDSSSRRRNPIEENYRQDVKKTPVPQMTPRPKREEDQAQADKKAEAGPAEISAHGDKVVAGKYRILREIGRGGMAVVYEAYETALDRKVALKKLKREIRDNPPDRERFLDEARLTARLKHHNIVDIYTILEGEDIFLVLEFVEGRTLSAVLDKYTKLPLKDSLAISKHVLRALDYAHRHNVVHRDLKPANIMIANDGFVRVMDFGIAGLLLDKGSVADCSGTAAYMAPEQETGKSDRRSDIFSFGATLYEMLTGDLPFPGPNFTAQKQRRGFRPARELNPKVSSRLDRLITTCLDPEPERRYQNTADILAEIRLIQAGQ